MNKKKAFIFSVIFWFLFLGLFFIIRFVGTGFRPLFIDTNWELMVNWIIASLIIATIFWLGLLLERHPNVRSLAYYKLTFLKSGLLMIAIFVFSLTTILIAILHGYVQNDVWAEYTSWVYSPLFLTAIIYVFISAIIISFIWQMAIKNGPNVLVNLLLGKYHHPREEQRIFIFIDLKGSTTIAEKIGHFKYSQLIQDCFADLTESAIKHNVEIYQYVGDEAVLTWKTVDGLRNNNCIYAFYYFHQTLTGKSAYYTEKYGLVPEFKAGVNSGVVVVTEVGIIKKEIAYHSDVLNTAARIQGMCNELKSELLISEEVMISLAPDNNLIFEDVGIFELRGKQTGVKLFKVTQTGIPEHLR